jgi:hypothetical protein
MSFEPLKLSELQMVFQKVESLLPILVSSKICEGRSVGNDIFFFCIRLRFYGQLVLDLAIEELVPLCCMFTSILRQRLPSQEREVVVHNARW